MTRRKAALTAALLTGVLLSAQGNPPAAQAPPAGPATGPLAALAPRAAVQAIVIDPGHGGDDAGVTSQEGVVEKDLTLQVARRVKALIETRLGIRVLLTREDDRDLGPDERAAIANNSKADLFISLHFNGGLTEATNGAEVYYLGLDREGQEALKATASDSLALPVIGGGTRPVDLVRWDMAQARFIPASTELARILEEALRARVPMGPRPLQAAPMRVLVGVNMPAALIELAYLTNLDQSQAAASETFQASVTQAIYDSVLRFRDYVEGPR